MVKENAADIARRGTCLDFSSALNLIPAYSQMGAIIIHIAIPSLRPQISIRNMH